MRPPKGQHGFVPWKLSGLRTGGAARGANALRDAHDARTVLTTEALQRTPLHTLHVELGARLVPFAGYEMPVQYPSGILAEHRHTRAAAGLFDVSHMGQARLHGTNAASALETLVPMDLRGLAFGRQRYAFFTNDAGGILDDLMVTNRGDFLYLVVNAARKAADFELLKNLDFEILADRALLALQGPTAAEAIARLSPRLASMPFMSSDSAKVGDFACQVSRSGYTGEDGFEIYCEPAEAERLWRALLESGGPMGLEPAGLGARDTLRLEKGYPLYGHELDDTTTPLEAGLEWVTKFAKGPFIGREALLKQKERGVLRKLVGLELLDPGIARRGYALFKNGKSVGQVTSGTKSPTLGKSIALAYVASEEAGLNNSIQVEIRGRKIEAKIVPLPFYRRLNREACSPK